MYPTLFTTPGLARFAEEIDAERARQLAKFGDQRHPDGTGTTEYANAAGHFKAACERNADAPLWSFVLLEEVYEALAETDPTKLRAELVQVSAVCAAWVSDLDRRPTDGLPPELLGTASGEPGDETYKPALCGCGNPTHSPLTACPPPVHWAPCTPAFLRLHPGACQTALRLPGDGVSVSHFHPQPDRP